MTVSWEIRYAASFASLPPGTLPPAASVQPIAPVSAGLTVDPEPIGAGRDDPAWLTAPWLAELVAGMPHDASWPRLMTLPHPDAVGSYGADVARASEARTGRPLRWWQQLAAVRVLEHDAAGGLVWPFWLLSTARQVGKSWLLRELLLWRLGQTALFGEPQLILHTGKDLPVCREVQRPARAWAKTQPGWTVRESNGTEEIETPDGSRWLIRGRGSVYGYSASLGAVDEAWKVAPEIVEDGIEPTMAERASAQLGLLSTAHRLATTLVPARRLAALAQLAAPADTLLLEWSAIPDAELSDRASWRAASPSWSDRREKLIASQYQRATTAGKSDDPDEPDPVEAFRSQWLNIWARPTAQGDDSVWLDGVAWEASASPALQPDGPLVIALEDHYGRGVGCVAVAMLAPGAVLVWGSTFDRRPDAANHAAMLAESHPGSRLVIGPTLADEPAFSVVPADRVPSSATMTRAGLALLRDVVADGRLRHDGGIALTRQILGARVIETTSGLTIASTQSRADLVRALANALLVTLRPAPAAPPRFRIR